MHHKIFFFFSCVCIKWLILISLKKWNNTEVSVIKTHENDNVNKTVLLLLSISDASKRWGVKNLYDLTDKETKGKYGVEKMSELTKPQIREYKIDRAKLIRGSKHTMYVHEDVLI